MSNYNQGGGYPQGNYQQYPDALPSSYNANQQQPQQPQYGQYYNYDHQQYQQQPGGPGDAYAQQQQQQQQPQKNQGKNNYNGNDNNNGAQSGHTNQVAYNPPMTSQPAAQATPAYYDYTVPQTFDDVKKVQGSGEWAVGLCGAPCAEPCFCLSACFCPWCCTYLQRRKLLMDDWSRYRCCAGLCGQCLCLGSNCGPCARCCMVMETCFCLSCAVHGNRYMVMQHYGLGQDCCDCIIIWAACILSCIGYIIGNEWIQIAADCIYCIVIACLLSQNEHQMKKYSYPVPASMS